MNNPSPPNVITLFTLPRDVDIQTFELLRTAIGEMATDIPQLAVREGDVSTETIRGDGTRVRANVLHREDVYIFKGHTIVVEMQIEQTRAFTLAARGALLLARVLTRITSVPVTIKLVAPEST